MTFQAETISGRDTDPCHSFPYRGPHREPDRESVCRRTRSRISNGKRFDPKKVKPGSSAARHYADIQAELLQAAGPDITPQLKLMVLPSCPSRQTGPTSCAHRTGKLNRRHPIHSSHISLVARFIQIDG